MTDANMIGQTLHQEYRPDNTNRSKRTIVTIARLFLIASVVPASLYQTLFLPHQVFRGFIKRNTLLSCVSCMLSIFHSPGVRLIEVK